jgi:hypothetical protein
MGESAQTQNLCLYREWLVNAAVKNLCFSAPARSLALFCKKSRGRYRIGFSENTWPPVSPSVAMEGTSSPFCSAYTQIGFVL